MKTISYSLLHFPTLSLSDQLTLSCAPVNLKCHFNINTFRTFLEYIAERRPCPLEFDMRRVANPRTFLGVVESFYKALDLYLWVLPVTKMYSLIERQ